MRFVEPHSEPTLQEASKKTGLGAQAPNEVLPTPSTPWRMQRLGRPAPDVLTSAMVIRFGPATIVNLHEG